MRFDAVIFDFDGVLIESEFVSSQQIARTLSEIGHPTSVEQALDRFTGLGGSDFIDAVAAWIGKPVPEAFHTAREAEDARVLAEGLDAVEGAVAFVQDLPPTLPIAVASSSTSHWIETHLDHLGLRGRFGRHVYSGREHVKRGKPAPEIYLYAANAIGIAIDRCAIIEDSPVGVTGAVASGATVIGLAAGRHCGKGHDRRLLERGAHHIGHDFASVTALLA